MIRSERTKCWANSADTPFARVCNEPRSLNRGFCHGHYLLQWAGRLDGGKRYDLPISLLDIIPTELTAAGVEAHQSLKLDGVNLLPFLEGAEEGAPHEHLLWRSGANSAARKGSWKLLQSEGGLTRLYNVDDDPGESQDFSNAHPQLIEELQGISKMGGRQGRTLRRNTEYHESFQRGPHRVVCLGACGRSPEQADQFESTPSQADKRPFRRSEMADLACGRASRRVPDSFYRRRPRDHRLLPQAPRSLVCYFQRRKPRLDRPEEGGQFSKRVLVGR